LIKQIGILIPFFFLIWLLVKKNKFYIQAGAGIVADSDPSKEFEETQNKAGALVQALSVALDIE